MQSDQYSSPLYDPSGLSFSLSTDAEQVGSFDASSIAAHRLGIGIASTKSKSGEEPNSDAASIAPEEADANEPATRGRRRHRLAADDDALMESTLPDDPQHPSEPQLAPKPDPEPEPDSNPLPVPVPVPVPMPWWQRPPPSSTTPASGIISPSAHPSPPPLLPPLQPLASASPGSSSAATAPPNSFQQRGLSPAAQFLLNLHSPSAASSPISPRPALASPLDTTQSGPSRPPVAETWCPSPFRRRFSEATASSAPSHLTGLGSRVGPEGRYLLGDILAYGGFSTIRQVFDLSASPNSASSPASSDPTNHTSPFDSPPTLAGKLVYSNEEGAGVGGTQPQAKAPNVSEDWMNQEMQLWRQLPSSEHLLPLVWHERIPLDSSTPAPLAKDNATRVDVLIMPLCSGGSLLDYVRHEGMVKPASHTVQRRDSNASTIDLTPSPTLSGPRTSRASSIRARPSGLSIQIPLPHERRPASDAAFSAAAGAYRSSINCDLPTTRSSFSGSTAQSTSLRRVGSTTSAPRSRGVPLSVTREVMYQVTQGLRALHHEAHIVHNDIKLDNILCMLEADVPQGEDTSHGTDPGAEATRTVWKISDFGLAARVDTALDNTPATPQDTSIPPRRSGQQLLARGGSMPYTAPEVLRDNDEQAHHAFAADMWALGCVLYALVSGRLPFRDQFEPRLQAKIQKAEWEMPIRLRRHRVAQQPNTTPSSLGLGFWPSSSSGTSASNSLARARTQLERSGSWGNRYLTTAGGHARNLSGGNMFPSPLSQHSPQQDLSASTPALPPSMVRNASLGNSSASIPWNQGATGTDDGKSESDPLSDAEQEQDMEWNGTSEERRMVRQVLRGLLHPDPGQRWNVDRLAQSAWLTPVIPPTTTEFARDVCSVESSGGNLSRLRPTPEPQYSSTLPHPGSITETAAEDDGPLMPGAIGTPEEEPAPLPRSLATRASRESLPFLGFVPPQVRKDLVASSYDPATAEVSSVTHSPLDIPRSRSGKLSTSGSMYQSGWDGITGLGMSSMWDQQEPRGRARGRAPPNDRSQSGGSTTSASASRSRSRFRTPVSSGPIDRQAAQRRSLSRSRTRADDALASLLEGTSRWAPSSLDTSRTDTSAAQISEPRTYPPLKEDETLDLPQQRRD